MSDKKLDYKLARDLAWDVLIRNDVSTLPIDIFYICRKENVPVFKYSYSIDIIKDLNLEHNMEGNDAFSFGNMIFYDGTQSKERKRFSIAHELGHVLMHTPEEKRIFYRSDMDVLNPLESEANIFAARLLAPLCVLQFLNLNSPKEIADACNISYSSAVLRFKRLCEIRKRSSERYKDKNHGTFLMSKREKTVLKNFENYINENKRTILLPLE